MAAVAYIDSSVVLKLIMNEPESGRTRELMMDLESDDYLLASSQLMTVEVKRVMFRVNGSFGGVESVLSRLSLISIEQSTLDIAASIPHHIKTLDAIHVATALEVNDPGVVLVSNDGNMLGVAEKMGLRTVGLG